MSSKKEIANKLCSSNIGNFREVPITVIIPTKNSGGTLKRCLESIQKQSLRPYVVVVDNYSSDTTEEIGREYADCVLVLGPERSAQRNAGAVVAKSDVIGFIDSDMYLQTEVVEQVKIAFEDGADAVIVPEQSIGEGYWAEVRAFERSFYIGCDGVEAARFFRHELFDGLGGFDENLDAGEDWDLTLRARAAGFRIVSISAIIEHDEGHLSYRGDLLKKAAYAKGIRLFISKHGRGALVAGNRPWLKRPWLLAKNPKLGVGLVLLKMGEVFAVIIALTLDALASPFAHFTKKI